MAYVPPIGSLYMAIDSIVVNSSSRPCHFFPQIKMFLVDCSKAFPHFLPPKKDRTVFFCYYLAGISLFYYFCCSICVGVDCWLVVSDIFYFPFHIWDNPSH